MFFHKYSLGGDTTALSRLYARLCHAFLVHNYCNLVDQKQDETHHPFDAYCKAVSGRESRCFSVSQKVKPQNWFYTSVHPKRHLNCFSHFNCRVHLCDPHTHTQPKEFQHVYLLHLSTAFWRRDLKMCHFLDYLFVR